MGLRNHIFRAVEWIKILKFYHNEKVYNRINRQKAKPAGPLKKHANGSPKQDA